MGCGNGGAGRAISDYDNSEIAEILRGQARSVDGIFFEVPKWLAEEIITRLEMM